MPCGGHSSPDVFTGSCSAPALHGNTISKQQLKQAKQAKLLLLKKLLCDLSFAIPQDTGVSVRKRVIKIMKDICVMQPDFPKTSEICVKIIRRIGDEEGIKVQANIAIAVYQQSLPVPSMCAPYLVCRPSLPSNW